MRTDWTKYESRTTYNQWENTVFFAAMQPATRPNNPAEKQSCCFIKVHATASNERLTTSLVMNFFSNEKQFFEEWNEIKFAAWSCIRLTQALIRSNRSQIIHILSASIARGSELRLESFYWSRLIRLFFELYQLIAYTSVLYIYFEQSKCWTYTLVLRPLFRREESPRNSTTAHIMPLDINHR